MVVERRTRASAYDLRWDCVFATLFPKQDNFIPVGVAENLSVEVSLHLIYDVVGRCFFGRSSLLLVLCPVLSITSTATGCEEHLVFFHFVYSPCSTSVFCVIVFCAS